MQKEATKRLQTIYLWRVDQMLGIRGRDDHFHKSLALSQYLLLLWIFLLKFKLLLERYSQS